MAIRKVGREDRALTDLLDSAEQEPMILRREGGGDFALLPMDDDVADLVLERSPAFIEHCRQIRGRMKQGDYHTQEEVLRLLELEPAEAEPKG
jgi:hypothetical protein